MTAETVRAAVPAGDTTAAPAGAPVLADLTTLRLGGPVGRYVETDSQAALVDVVREADAAGEPVLVLGGGSNLVVADAGFPGVVVHDVRRGVEVESADACGGASIRVPAG